MIIKVKTECYDDIIKLLKNERTKEALDQSRWWSRREDSFDLNIGNLPLVDLKSLRDYFRSVRARVFVRTLNSIIDALESPDQTIISDLRAFERSLKEIIYKNTDHKWVFRFDNNYNFLIPYFVFNIHYIPAVIDSKRDFYEEPYVAMEIHLNKMDGFSKEIKRFYESDIANQTIFSCLKNSGFVLETKDLYEEYHNINDIFKLKREEFGKQYKSKSYYSKDTSYFNSRRRIKEDSDLITPFFKIVNDFRRDNRHFNFKTSCSLWQNIKRINPEIKEIEDSDIYKIPILPFISGYNIDTHEEVYCHAADIEDYIYDDLLSEKLVLPEIHRDLLDILINDENILKGDIIDNKGNGTVIILEGLPGSGKTLSVEVYSEIIKKPLYKISAGQLGINPKDIDSNLDSILRRSSRLDCILLIDECETFVRSRGSDIVQNAIVTTFLRKIEYFNGILFLTSNKIKDIDDAILSRCIATIRYEKPTPEDAIKIWRILINEFNVESEISDKTISQCIKVFPNAVGRDIKELLKLTIRYCRSKNIPINISAFISCAQFRAIDVDTGYVK